MTDEGRAKARLDRLRRRLDALDDELLALVARRAAVVDEVAVLKQGHGQPLHDAEREGQILARLVAQRPARLGVREVEVLVQAVLRACSAESTSAGPTR